MTETAAPFRVAVYEGTGSRPFDPAVRAALVGALLQKGIAVTVVRPGGSVSHSSAGNLVVVPEGFNGLVNVSKSQ